MQGEPHPHAHDHQHPSHHPARGDASPLPPASPSLTTFHRPAADEPSLRRRTSRNDQPREEISNGEIGIIRISIATPYSDSPSGERRKEVPVHITKSVSELKDEIASGAFHDDEKWYREGMRLVWQGRIVRDVETVGDIVNKARDPNMAHTFHLVARRKGATTRSRTAAYLPPTTVPAPALTSSPPSPSVSSSPTHQALSDTIHYLLFMARHHLCHLLSAPPLEWEQMVPVPTVERLHAREAIMSVVNVFAEERPSRLEGWEEWEGSFVEDDSELWHEGGRDGLEAELKTLWSARVGRAWKDGTEGEVVSVDLDGIPYQLHLPPLDLMVPAQLAHLVIYLRLTSLIPLLNNVFALHTPPSIPTPTTALPAQTQAPAVRRVGFRLHITAGTVSHIFFSAVRVIALLWMLTRDMKWDDFRLWIIGGGAFGWWAGDAVRRIRPGFAWNGRPNPRAAPGAAPAQGEIPPNANGIPPNVAADPPFHAPAAAARMMGANRNSHIVNRLIPLVHLNTDAEYLHLTSRRRFQRPLKVITQWLLPIALWFITLIPEWEAVRARAIRRRERAIRVIVGELTTAAREREQQDGEQSGEGVGDDTTHEQEQPQRPDVLPPGLDETAKKYYQRVLDRGEGIDWEEEREAQRAMGMAEDEEPQGEGMRMRML